MAADPTDILRDIEMRPKIYCTIYAAPWTITRSSFKSQTNLVNTLLNKIDTNKPIGAIQKISVTTKRGAIYRREVNTRTAGRPVEVIPGLPSYELALERVVLYESNISQAFGYNSSYDIMKQNSPLVLYLDVPGVRKTINGQETETGAKTIIIYGVWFDNNDYDFSVEREDDMMIIQKVKAIATGVTSTKTGTILINQ